MPKIIRKFSLNGYAYAGERIGEIVFVNRHNSNAKVKFKSWHQAESFIDKQVVKAIET